MSPFAEVLRCLFDDTGIYDRSDWAYILCGNGAWPKAVAKAELESWLDDKAIPSPLQLNMLIITLERHSGARKEPLVKFNEMANKVASEVSPLGKRMLPTVYEYMKRPIFSELSSKLAKLPAEEKEALLESMYLKKQE